MATSCRLLQRRRSQESRNGKGAPARVPDGPQDDRSERPDEGPDVLRELDELPPGVESLQGVFQPKFEEQHLTRIQAAGGATWLDRPPLL
jgi:hypothetical protein